MRESCFLKDCTVDELQGKGIVVIVVGIYGLDVELVNYINIGCCQQQKGKEEAR